MAARLDHTVMTEHFGSVCKQFDKSRLCGLVEILSDPKEPDSALITVIMRETMSGLIEPTKDTKLSALFPPNVGAADRHVAIVNAVLSFALGPSNQGAVHPATPQATMRTISKYVQLNWTVACVLHAVHRPEHDDSMVSGNLKAIASTVDVDHRPKSDPKGTCVIPGLAKALYAAYVKPIATKEQVVAWGKRLVDLATPPTSPDKRSRPPVREAARIKELEAQVEAFEWQLAETENKRFKMETECKQLRRQFETLSNTVAVAMTQITNIAAANAGSICLDLPREPGSPIWNADSADSPSDEDSDDEQPTVGDNHIPPQTPPASGDKYETVEGGTKPAHAVVSSSDEDSDDEQPTAGHKRKRIPPRTSPASGGKPNAGKDGSKSTRKRKKVFTESEDDGSGSEFIANPQ